MGYPWSDRHTTVIRGREIAYRLGLSLRTFSRRLRGEGWVGFGFFKEGRDWCIREDSLDKLISGIEQGWIQRKHQHADHVGLTEPIKKSKKKNINDITE